MSRLAGFQASSPLKLRSFLNTSGAISANTASASSIAAVAVGRPRAEQGTLAPREEGGYAVLTPPNALVLSAPAIETRHDREEKD